MHLFPLHFRDHIILSIHLWLLFQRFNFIFVLIETILITQKRNFQFCFNRYGWNSQVWLLPTIDRSISQGRSCPRMFLYFKFSVSLSTSLGYWTLRPSASLFYEMLNIVENLRKRSSSAVFSFLKSVLAKTFPNPGETLSIRTFDGDDFSLSRSDNDFMLDFVSLVVSIDQKVSFGTLFRLLETSQILDILAALLTECRIILCAKSVSTLSSCVNALSALIYPFTWQVLSSLTHLSACVHSNSSQRSHELLLRSNAFPRGSPFFQPVRVESISTRRSCPFGFRLGKVSPRSSRELWRQESSSL